MMKHFLTGVLTVLFLRSGFTQQDSILLFVSYQETYYSEYIVMLEALLASGYYVDVRSAGNGTASTYTIGGDLVSQADGLSGSNYAAFEAQFLNMFETSWNTDLNPVPASIPVAGMIQSVTSMVPYKALVVVGGTGAVDYRIDGNYASQGALDAFTVQAAAEKLNLLAVEALLSGKPVMGQCHGASIPAYWRVPNTTGNGFDNLGHSLLSGSIATGFPEPATSDNLADLNITFRADDKVVVGTPHSSLADNDYGTFKIITTRDWYPQTIAHAAKTLTNILTSYPPPSLLQTPVSVLIIHGGPVDPDNCNAGNPDNDVPCNYGTDPPSNIPADYTDLVSLFTSNQFSDGFSFTVADVNLFDVTPFSLDDQSEIFNYLSAFDVVFFYKHWSSQVTPALQNAIVDYADHGGGVVSIHHGMYNQDKNILVNNLFQAHSPAATWSANRTNYQIFQTNYGHFVSTYGILNDGVSSAPAAWIGNPLLPGSNQSLSLYPRFGLSDELYNNMQFVPAASFGDSINQINPLFSNDQTPSGQCHVHGFVRLFDADADQVVGRVVYGEAGETVINYQYPHPYAQFIRNAVYWARGDQNCSTNNPVWNGGSGNWDQVANWSGTAIPDACSEVSIPDQVSEITVSLPNATEIEIRLIEIGLQVIFSTPPGTTFSVLGN